MSDVPVNDTKVLISGGGIAGLTLGILLKERGWDPLVIERDPALRTEGYQLLFFGTGWDMAERMGLVDDILKVRYPIDSLEYVGRDGNSVFPALPIDRVRRALGGKNAFLRRQDLERILFDRSTAVGVPVRFGTTIQSVHEGDSGVNVTFDDGTTDTFRLVFGADGVHSRVRELLFGPESQFERFLGYYTAAFHAQNRGYNIRRSLGLYEEPGRIMWCYPVDDQHIDVLYTFRHGSVGRLPREKRLAFVREQLKGCGWVTESVLGAASSSESIYFDALTQIVLPVWHKGRIALLGDACGCLTLIAAQGSHMAMASAYVIARELERYRGDHQHAFSAYERFMKPFIAKKQNGAKWFVRLRIPSSRLEMMVRYPLLRIVFSDLFIGHV
jgi:2-polyprenyl-6-methoxyphenol hydroxylase-like FAD-dependent oxidoreductase